MPHNKDILAKTVHIDSNVGIACNNCHESLTKRQVTCSTMSLRIHLHLDWSLISALTSAQNFSALP